MRVTLKSTCLADEAAVGQLVQQAQQQRRVGFVAERRQQRPPCARQCHFSFAESLAYAPSQLRTCL